MLYNIKIPAVIRQIIALFFLLKLWTYDENNTLIERGRRLLYYLYFVSFITSDAFGAYFTVDKDERIFLTVLSIVGDVLIYKLWFILWKQDVIFELIHEIEKHFTDDQEEIIRVNNKSKKLLKFVQYFVVMVFSAVIFTVVVFPIVNEERLFLNIAFPLNRSNSQIATWIAFGFSAGGIFAVAVCCVFAPIIWYLFYGFVLRYEMLGDQIRKMGEQKGSELNVRNSLETRQKLYAEDLIAAIHTYDEINEYADIHLVYCIKQIATSGLCICGAVYSLAYSSHEDIILDGIFCILLAYSFLDIFMITYLANEITLLSGKLLYCLFESNWIEQTQQCKKNLLIFGERLKQPQEIVVGKIYVLDLVLFNSIVNGAYSMFNILKNFR